MKTERFFFSFFLFLSRRLTRRVEKNVNKQALQVFREKSFLVSIYLWNVDDSWNLDKLESCRLVTDSKNRNFALLIFVCFSFLLSYFETRDSHQYDAWVTAHHVVNKFKISCFCFFKCMSRLWWKTTQKFISENIHRCVFCLWRNFFLSFMTSFVLNTRQFLFAEHHWF